MNIPPEIMAIASAMFVATVIAAIVVGRGNDAGHPWVRRIFLIIINLHPLNWGTWKTSFSKREAFLASWFLAFISVLILISLYAIYGHRIANAF